MPAALLDDAKTDSEPPSLVHIAYDKLIRAGARWVFTSSPALPSGDDTSPLPPTAIDDDEHTPLVVDVTTDSPASPSGDESPTTRDQDTADDVRVMREAYGRQWVVDHVKASKRKLHSLKKSKSLNPASSSALMAEVFQSASGDGASLPSETNMTPDESAQNAKRIKVLLEKEKERTLLLETQLAAFKEMCHDTETRSKKMETAFHEAESRADNLQSQVVKLQSSLSDSTQQLLSADSTKHELKSVKRGAYYKRLARKERAMKAKLSKLPGVSTSDCDTPALGHLLCTDKVT